MKLVTAAKTGNFPKVQELINGKEFLDQTDPNTGNSALHEAASLSHTRIVEVLLQNMANPNLTNEKQQTPLHLVSNSQIAFLLHGAKAKLEIRDVEQHTPLLQAARLGRLSAVWALLRAGASADSYVGFLRSQRMTTLYYVCVFKSEDVALQLRIIQLLIAMQVDLNVHPEGTLPPIHILALQEKSHLCKDAISALYRAGAMVQIAEFEQRPPSRKSTRKPTQASSQHQYEIAKGRIIGLEQKNIVRAVSDLFPAIKDTKKPSLPAKLVSQYSVTLT